MLVRRAILAGFGAILATLGIAEGLFGAPAQAASGAPDAVSPVVRAESPVGLRGQLAVVPSSRIRCSTNDDIQLWQWSTAGILAFHNCQNLYVWKPGDRQSRRVDAGGKADMQYFWLPDGRGLLYTDTRSHQVRLFNVDSGTTKTLCDEATDPGYCQATSLSPDGRHFTTRGNIPEPGTRFESERLYVYTIDPEGTVVGRADYGGTSAQDSVGGIASWSPDSRYLAYEQGGRDQLRPSSWTLTILDVATGQSRPASSQAPPLGDRGPATVPIWSWTPAGDLVPGYDPGGTVATIEAGPYGAGLLSRASERSTTSPDGAYVLFTAGGGRSLGDSVPQYASPKCSFGVDCAFVRRNSTSATTLISPRAVSRRDRQNCTSTPWDQVWSYNGRFVTYACFGRVGKDDSAMYIYDTRTGRSQIASTDGRGRMLKDVGGNNGAGGIFTPDGRSIAFQADGRLFVKQLS